MFNEKRAAKTLESNSYGKCFKSGGMNLSKNSIFEKLLKLSYIALLLYSKLVDLYIMEQILKIL